MKCPVCKTVDLLMSEKQGVEIDYCPECRGVWLDRNELDKIIERASSNSTNYNSYDNNYNGNNYNGNNYNDNNYNGNNPKYNEHRDEYGNKHHRKHKKESILSEIFDIFD